MSLNKVTEPNQAFPKSTGENWNTGSFLKDLNLSRWVYFLHRYKQKKRKAGV